ncbi:MAG: hypothetical protein Q9226_008359 [Calogaya cf. arnoldii]
MAKKAKNSQFSAASLSKTGARNIRKVIATDSRAAAVRNAQPQRPTLSTANEKEAPSSPKKKMPAPHSPSRKGVSTANPTKSFSDLHDSTGGLSHHAKHTSQQWPVRALGGELRSNQVSADYVVEHWDELQTRKTRAHLTTGGQIKMGRLIVFVSMYSNRHVDCRR